MTGFGIRELFAAGKKLEGIRLWREQSFLQQLSMNGSLLLTDNHDETWRRILADLLGLTPGSEWSHLRSILRLVPASVARRALWRASYLWWLAESEMYLDALRRAAQIGRLEELRGTPHARALERRLELRARQLEALEWCGFDSGDEDQIEVVELGRGRGTRRQGGKAKTAPAKRSGRRRR